MGNPRLPVYGQERPKRLPKDLTGMFFGRLKVVELMPKGPPSPPHTGQLYMCECACGVYKPVRREYLVNGTQSCGCRVAHPFSTKPELRPYEATYRTLLYANRNRYNVYLTYDEFLKFTEMKVCHYCGDALHWQEWADNNGGYKLDRKDNDFGYSVDNCVPCCTRCNIGKGNRFTYDEWYGMTRYFREKDTL